MHPTTLSPLRVLCAAALLSLAALLAALVPASGATARPDGIAGGGACALDVVNRDAGAEATVIVDFYRHGSGGPAVVVPMPPVASLRHGTLDLGALGQLPLGAWAAIVSSDRSLGVVRRCAWRQTGAAMARTASEPGTVLMAPYVRLDGRDDVALFTMQNTDTSTAANVVMDVHFDGPSPTMSQTYAVQPGRAITIDTDHDPIFTSLPAGAIGAIALRSSTVLAGNLIVDFVDSARGAADAAFQPVDAAATTLLAPRVRRGTEGDRTRLQLVNPGVDDGEAHLRLVGTEGACAGTAYDVGPVALPGHGMAEIDAADPAAGLPEGCVAAGVVTATVGVLGTVLETAGAGRDAAAYEAVAPAVAERWLLAVRWAASDVSEGTTLDLFNPGAEPAEVNLAPIGPDGVQRACSAGCALSIPPGAGTRVASADLDTDLPPGTVGSLLVTSGAPMVGVLGEGGPGATQDLTLMTLVGVEDGASRPPGPVFVALLLNEEVPLATAVPMPGGGTPSSTTPPPTATAPPPTATTAVPPTGTVPGPTAAPSATPLPAGGPSVAPGLAGRVPAAAIAAALADPSSVAGWDRPCNPNVPDSPRNGRRRTLRLQNPSVPYHPLFNTLVFTCG